MAEWHWLKMAADGLPVLPLASSGSGCRRPYEPLLLAHTAGAGDARSWPPPPPRAVLLSPPGPHSCKPRLQRLLRRFASCDVAVRPGSPAVPPATEACELFARELCTDVTSWGNEPLRFQEALALT